MIPVREMYRGQSYKLFDDYNNVHVFVEDAGFENLYREIFKQCGLPIEKVFSRNGKQEIVDEAVSCRDPKCVFIVDRDWDDLLGIEPILHNVVVLKKHSIENYLIEYSGFSKLVLGDKPKANINELLSKQQFDAIIEDVSRKLLPLFECFATMQMLATGRTGCAYDPGHFQKKNSSCAPDEKKISEFIDAEGEAVPYPVINYFSGDVLRDRGHGKYMLHFVWMGVRNLSKVGQLSMDRLMMRLAQLVKSSDLEVLCEQVMLRPPTGTA